MMSGSCGLQEDHARGWVEGRSEKMEAEAQSLVSGCATSLGRAGLLRQLWGTGLSGGLWVIALFWNKEKERERNQASAVEPHLSVTYISLPSGHVWESCVWGPGSSRAPPSLTCKDVHT